MKAAAGILGALFGAVAGIAALFLLIFATWDGNTLAFGFGVVLGGIPAAVIGSIGGFILAYRICGGIQTSNPQARKRWIAAACSSVVCAVALVASAHYALQTSDMPPNDKELLANFHKHRSDFDQLAAMAIADKTLMRVDKDWTNPEKPGVSDRRIDLYRILSKDAQVPRGFTRVDDGIQFMYWGVGSAVSDDIDKGYAYLPTPPAKTLASLDKYEFPNVERQTVYRHIEGHWYLYIQYIED